MTEKLAYLVNKKTGKITNRIILDDEQEYKTKSTEKLVFPDELKREETQDIGEVFGEVKPEPETEE